MAIKQVNTNICTLEDVGPAIQAQNEINNILNEAIQNIVLSGTSDHKVSLDAADEAGFGSDYLHAKITHAGTAPDSNSVIVGSVTAGTTESFYWQPDDINNFGAATNMYLAMISGSLTWVEIDATVDSYTVKVTTGDSTPNFLHDCFDLNAAYLAGADMLVGTATVGVDGTNQTEQLFVDVSLIAGWAGSGDFFLGMSNNAVSWVSFSSIVSGGLSPGYAIDLSGSTVSFDPTEITAFAPAFQMYMHFDDATTKFDPLWQTVDDYDDTKERYLSTNGAGGFRWANKPADGASGTFVCELSATVSGTSVSTMGPGTGTVYGIAAGGGLSSLGTRTIFNPYKSSLPQTSGGATVRYTCEKTHIDILDSTNDEFTITGIDPPYLLAALGGYAAGKSLYTDGSAVTDMKWGGKQCSG